VVKVEVTVDVVGGGGESKIEEMNRRGFIFTINMTT
jgi:hypothetical protein